MLIIKVKDGQIEKALKQYKSKVIKTKQMKKLNELREFVKPSEEKRQIKIKAVYKENKNRED